MGIYDQFYYHPTKTIEALSETPSDHIDIDALLSNHPPFVNNVDVTYKAKRTLVVHGFDLKKWNHHQITLLSTRLHNLIRAGFTVLHFHSGNIKPIDPTQIAVYMGNSKFWDGSPAPDRHLLATLCNIPVDALCLLNEADMMEMLQGDRSDWENDVGLKQIKYEIRAINVDGLNQLLLASADTLETLTLDNHMLRNTALAENIHLPHLTELHMKSTCGGYYNLQHKDVIALLKSAPNVRVLSLPSLPDLSGTPDRNSPNSIDLDRAVLYAIQKPELMTQFVLDNFDNYSHSLELLLAKMQQLKVLKLNYVEFKTTSVIPGIHGLEHLSLTNVNISTKQLGHLLSQSPNLKSLVIAHNTKLTDPITDSLRFAELEELELQSVHFNVHSLLKIINKSKTLKRLKLEYCSFTGNAQALSVNMTGLEELSLINCDNVELWLPQILSQATQLKKIVVNRCYKQDPSITTSQPFAQLEILNVSETAMTLPTLQQLLKGAHQLKVIHLNECDLDALLPLIQAPNLTVFVAAAGKINPHNLAELKLRSKNLNLLRILKCSQIAYDHRASFPIPAIEQISIEASDLTINGLLNVLERVPCKKLAIHHGQFIYDSKPVPEQTLPITELDVHTVRFSPGSLEQLLQHTGNIKKLRLHDCIGNFQLSTKTRLDLANLTVLELYAVNMNRTSLLYLVEQSPKLQELIINSCDQFTLQFLSFLNVPTVIFSDGEKTITIGSTRNDSVEMDANTHKYPNQVQRVKRLFIGNPKTPAPRDVRIDCYTTATLNPNSRGDADPFILENSGDLQLEEIPGIETARKKTPLYDAFQKAGPHHYLGRFPMEITHTWQAFPSLFPDEKLTQFYVATGQQVEIQRSKRNDFCYIRLHKNAAPLTEPVNVEILLSRAPPKFTYDSLPEFIKALAIFCRGFRDQDLTNVPADATAQTFLNAMISSRNGACRHRSFVFKYLMHQQHAQIPIRLMTNGIHMFPEVYYHNTWIRCDLGGYASTVIIDEHTFPEAPQTEESQSEEPQELFEFTMSPNGKKFIDASYFQTARNVSTITLKDYTSFDSLFGLQNLSIIETLNIRQSSIDAAGLHRLLALTYNIKTLNLSNCTIPEIEFNQLDFSILSKLEFVSITGHSVPNTAALQRLIQTAPANVQTVTDYDCQNESGTSISNITVIEKPRRIPSRYFQNTTQTQTSLDIASLVTANWRTGLIDTKSVEQLRLAQQQYCIDKHIPNYYIHSADELVCSAPYIQRQGQYGYIKKGPGGPLHDFLKDIRDNSVVIINYNDFAPAHIAAKNAILDDNRRADGTPVPVGTKIIGLIDSSNPTCYQGADFYSRFAYQNVFDYPLSHFLFQNADQNPRQHTIELCGGSNWIARLIGSWELRDKKLYFKEGELIGALQKGKSQITLNNAPRDNPAFQRFLHDLHLHQGVFHKGRLHHPTPKDFSIRFTDEVSFPDKHVILQLTEHAHETHCHVLNETAFSAFLGVFRCDENSKNAVRDPGFIAQYHGQCMPVYLTGPLSSYKWLALFEQCQIHNTTLQIQLAPGVELIEALKPAVMPTGIRANEATHTQLIIGTRLPTKLGPDAIIIDISELKPADLLPTITSKFDEDNLIFEFTDKKGFLAEVLKQNRTVVLKGTWSKQLSEALHPLIMERLQAKQVSGKLMLLTKNPDNFSLLSATAIQARLKVKRKAIHLDAQYEERYDKVVYALTYSPFVLLTGATGVGKTHFIYHVWKKQHPACHIGEDKIGDWIHDQSPGIKTLFIDEANITNRQWSEFKGLLETPPSIFYKGKYYPLTKDHKVIFAANPLSYGGERQAPELFQKHPCEVQFNPLPELVIAQSLELPPAIAKPIVDVNTFVSHLNENDTLITARETLMMACLTKTASLNNPNLDPVLIAQHFAYHLSKPHVPTAHLHEFNQRFTPKTSVPTPSVPLKDFVINKSNQEALDTLNQHLNLRHCRLQKSANLPLQGGLGGVVIEGEPGIGKSELVIQLLQARGLNENVDFFRIPASMNTEDKETLLQNLFHAGKIAVIDEINSAPMMERVLNALLEGRDLDGKPADNPGFMLIGTQNPISFAGRRKTTLPMQHRLQTIKMPVYSKDEMLGIVKHLGVPTRIAKDIVAEFEIKKKTDKKICFRNLVNTAKHWRDTQSNSKEIKINLKALPQIGALCKTVAVANVEAYFAEQLQYNAMPLWSRKQNTPSIRKLVKQDRSVQGEILEYSRWEKSLQTLGFETQTIDFADNINNLIDNVKTHLAAGNLPLIAFAVVRDVGQPDPDPSEPHDVEHAAVITGFNPMTDEFTLAHWGKSYTVDIVELFNANQALPETRTKEAYFKNPEYQPKDKDITCKYLLDKTGGIQDRLHSITPQEKTGFKNKLLVVKSPDRAELLNKRFARMAQLPRFFKPGSVSAGIASPATVNHYSNF